MVIELDRVMYRVGPRGKNSLVLTVPNEVVKRAGLAQGGKFKTSAEIIDGELILTYRRPIEDPVPP